ncbi:MAG: DNA alkylation repair protein [Chlorobi bacterium]|nr:DNA alkylation repair protein [Chlorobiota bacterium]
MIDFIKILELEFRKNADPEIAAGQKAYMKNQFEFLGIKTPLRREIQRPFLTKKHLPLKNNLEQIVKTFWAKPEREFQYFAQELAQKYTDRFEKKDIKLFEFMITHKSWWDSVDFIAPKLVGEYFKVYSGQRNKYVEKWIASENIWLQRTSILFQLKYEDELDKEFLAYIINSLLGSNEFFINKAIGWILRQYSKKDPAWVNDFTNKTPLDKLSRKEALRLIAEKNI